MAHHCSNSAKLYLEVDTKPVKTALDIYFNSYTHFLTQFTISKKHLMRRSVCLSNPGINAIDRMSCSWSIAITLKENHRDGEIIVTWSSSGLRSLPTAIFSLHKWLHIYVKLLKFADDTTVISLIQDSDESAYRQEVEQLAVWCHAQNCRDDSGLSSLTLTPSWKKLSRGCTSFVNWKSSTCHRRIWLSFTLLLLSRFCAPL